MTGSVVTASPAPAPASVAPARESIHGGGRGDSVYRATITAFALCVPLLLGLIAVEVGVAAWPAFQHFGLGFLTSSRWDAVDGSFGAAPAIGPARNRAPATNRAMNTALLPC